MKKFAKTVTKSPKDKERATCLKNYNRYFGQKILLKNPLLTLTHRRLCSDYLDGHTMGMFFYLVQRVTPLCLPWPLTQLFPAAWAGSTGQCSVYSSLMSMQ